MDMVAVGTVFPLFEWEYHPLYVSCILLEGSMKLLLLLYENLNMGRKLWLATE